MKPHIWLLVAASILSPLAGGAQPATSTEDNIARLKLIDRNGDGALDADEVKWGLLYKIKKDDWILKMKPSVETVSILTAHDDNFTLRYLLFWRQHSAHKNGDTYTPIPFSELKAEEFGLPKVDAHGGLPDVPAGGDTSKPAFSTKGSLLLRRSLDKLPTLGDDKYQKEMTAGADKLASDGALFSYAHSFNPDANEWLAQGLVAYELPWKSIDNGEVFNRRMLFSAQFSRINFSGNGTLDKASPRFKKEDNLLNFGATYETLLPWPVFSSFTQSALRVNALWKTDWDMESQIPTAEIEWTPYNGTFGMGSFNDEASPYLWWLFDLTLHADGGYVVEDGKWSKMVKNDSFAHIGPKVNLALRPFPNSALFKDNPFVLTLGFNEFVDLTEDSKEVRAFTADMSWYLRKPKAGDIGITDPGIAITLAYRNYRNVENQTDDNSIILGLAVGF